MKFSDLGFSPKVLSGIESAGYETPTPIQAQAIPVANEGRDVLGIAQTGTGKTGAFVLPMLKRLESGRARARMPGNWRPRSWRRLNRSALITSSRLRF